MLEELDSQFDICVGVELDSSIDVKVEIDGDEEVKLEVEDEVYSENYSSVLVLKLVEAMVVVQW